MLVGDSAIRMRKIQPYELVVHEGNGDIICVRNSIGIISARANAKASSIIDEHLTIWLSFDIKVF